MRYIIFRSSKKEKTQQGLWECGKVEPAFWRDFSKRRWESALFADFHGRAISIRPRLGTHKFC
jgi:hypothetical protein